MLNRYKRLTRVRHLGQKVPQRLKERSVLVVGCGSLGSAAASLLVRSGVGGIRLIDRDVVTEGNLTDQCLYTEQDVAECRPKAEIAAERLAAFNGNVQVEGHVADFAPDNAKMFVDTMDLLIDCTDNLETKYLLNDVAVATHTPLVYAGCAGTQGVILAVLPSQTHCLRCLWPETPPHYRVDGCESMGLLPSTASFVAAVQVTEGLKILLGQTNELIGGLTRIDVWTAKSRKIPIPEFQPGFGNCPTCGKRDFPYLEGKFASRTTALCGGETVMIVSGEGKSDYARIRNRLAERFPIIEGSGGLRFKADGYQFLVFSSGRVFIHGVGDPLQARAVYGRYVAL